MDSLLRFPPFSIAVVYHVSFYVYMSCLRVVESAHNRRSLTVHDFSPFRLMFKVVTHNGLQDSKVMIKIEIAEDHIKTQWPEASQKKFSK